MKTIKDCLICSYYEEVIQYLADEFTEYQFEIIEIQPTTELNIPQIDININNNPPSIGHTIKLEELANKKLDEIANKIKREIRNLMQNEL